jgi:CRISPR-associated endonuclease/helicase Cas3
MIRINSSLFSPQARSLWAKKSRNGDLLWLPLPVHLSDTAEVAIKLWRRWVPDGVKRRIISGVRYGTEEDAERIFIFLATVHDLGKATPAFATKECGYRELDEQILERIILSGLPLETLRGNMDRSRTPHALASQILLQSAGCPASVAVILGAHHGKPPDIRMLEYDADRYPQNYHGDTTSKPVWQTVQQEFVDYALYRSGYASLSELPELDVAAQVLLSGLLVMADWISSDSNLFPYMRLADPVLPDSKKRADAAWAKLEFNLPWEAGNHWMSGDLYKERFKLESPRPIQLAIKQLLNQVQTPGIVVIEAPMGEGKTEAALAAAEILADMTKRRGVFFALPTQATSDGIFPRMLDWISHLDSEDPQSVRLVHGKAHHNETFRNLAYASNIDVDGEIGAYVHEWFTGRKRAILDDFVAGTIDQLLMAALKQKHVMLRHLGLANKVVIIDECHAYDAYMNCYLERTLNWLGMYEVPVIVMSATLPGEKRQMIVDAYCGRSFRPVNSRKVKNPFEPASNGDANSVRDADHKPKWVVNRSYPLITYTDRGEVKQAAVPSTGSSKLVQIGYLEDEAIMEKLTELLDDGGCAGIIVNSVKRSQAIARLLRQAFGEETVQLIHSRFLTPDRIAYEQKLLKELGKPQAGRMRPDCRIVVGTQVLEQSLDIDFDVLITDLCPMDLLLQRIGRLHRHERPRPLRLLTAMCWVTGVRDGKFEDASAAIYGEYLLMRTLTRLPAQIRLPEDIPELVQDVYDDNRPLMPETEAYRQARNKHHQLLEHKRNRAEAFRMQAPGLMKDMIGWLDTDVSDQHGEASVRDTEDSIEVVLVRRTASGQIAFLPWIHDGMAIDRYREPPEDTARKLARCTVRLPVAVTGSHRRLDETIRQLELLNMEHLAAWQQSPWLKGQLCLILDEQLTAEIGNYRISYHKDYGLEYSAKEVEQRE